MISFTPKEHQDYSKIKSKGLDEYLPSKLTVSIVMSYAAALRVHDTKSIGHINILLN